MPEAGTTGVAFALVGDVTAGTAGPGWRPPGSLVLLTRKWLQTSFHCELLSLLHHLSL